MKLEAILDSLPPSKLAKLSAFVGTLLDPDCEPEEVRAIMDLSNAAYAAGERNCGEAFTEQYFDAVIEIGA